MVSIENESDIERLRQVARLLEHENRRLHERLAKLTAELATARGEDVERLQLELKLLQEELDARTRQIYGASSEKRRRPKPKGKPEDKPQTGHGPKPQPQLDVVDAVHDLDEADKACPACGGQLAEMAGQYEESDEIDVVERRFVIRRHKRKKYRCGCGGCVETAPGPLKLIVGGRYSIEFAVHVAVEKYDLHMPLARQVRAMMRDGLDVDTQTLWDQLDALAGWCGPTYAALHQVALRSAVVGADETTWRMMDQPGGRTWYVWALSSPEAAWYRIFDTRSMKAGRELLHDFTGVVMTDGYEVYQALRRRAADEGKATFTLAFCWAHVRRGFIEAEPNYPRAAEVLELIGKLYEIEARVRSLEGDERTRKLAELRRTESKAVLEEIRKWLYGQAVLPKSRLGRAIRYTLDLWEGLVRFVDDVRIPLDNNATEREMRVIAVGRKNHYGSRSRRGTDVAALFYSLIESAKLAGVDPRDYLSEVARRAIAAPGAVLLPSDFARERSAVT